MVMNYIQFYYGYGVASFPLWKLGHVTNPPAMWYSCRRLNQNLGQIWLPFNMNGTLTTGP